MADSNSARSQENATETHKLLNPWLQVKLEYVTGIPEMVPVTTEMAQAYLGPSAKWSTINDCLTTAAEMQKTVAPQFNELRKYDQKPSTDAYNAISETSSLAELRSARDLFSSCRDKFNSVSAVLNNFMAGRLYEVKLAIEAQWGDWGYSNLLTFVWRATHDKIIVERLDELIKIAESDEDEKEKAEKAKKEEAEKEAAEKEKAEKEKAEKEKAEKEKEEKEKADKEKNTPAALKKEEVYIIFETKASNATLLLKSNVDNAEHSTEIKSGEGGAITASSRDGNPTSSPVALFVKDGNAFVITGALNFKGDGAGHIVSADISNSHLNVESGKDAQHFTVTWDGKTQTGSD